VTPKERKAHIYRHAIADRYWVAGVITAADLADDYNGVTAHPYRLGDCILAKLNLITKPMVRRNRARGSR
jgi:hypothetical protein